MSISRRLRVFPGFILALLCGTAVAAPVAGTDLTVREISQGEGEAAVPYSRVEVHYTGWLMDGTKFDSSRDRGQPFGFQLGAGQVIPGWDKGVAGMKPGGKRELTIPPQLAYGSRGAGAVIPPNATLRFEVELLSVTPPPFRSIDTDTMKAKLADGVKIIDIRRPDEWKKTGVVAGSHLLTAFDGRGRFVPSFPDELGKLVTPEEEFMLICRTGNRTAALSNALASRLGYKRLLNVEKGITHWIAGGGEVGKPVSQK